MRFFKKTTTSCGEESFSFSLTLNSEYFIEKYFKKYKKRTVCLLTPFIFSKALFNSLKSACKIFFKLPNFSINFFAIGLVSFAVKRKIKQTPKFHNPTNYQILYLKIFVLLFLCARGQTFFFHRFPYVSVTDR